MTDKNENGGHFLELCLIIARTIFQHRNIHKATMKSPDTKTQKQGPYYNYVKGNGTSHYGMSERRREAAIGCDQLARPS